MKDLDIAAGAPLTMQNLNDEQLKAVLHTGKPLLILAGAGSGKTQVITTKIAYFIKEKNVKPWSILAVTFTNKAAREMALRAALMESGAGNCMIKTFHSFGAWFLRRNASYAGLDPNFTIYDEEDSVSVLASVFPNKKKDELRPLAARIAKIKDLDLSPEELEFELAFDLSGAGRRGGGENNLFKDFNNVFMKYEEKLNQSGNVDFGDLIKKPAAILRDNPELKRRVQDRFRFILVDEYQDANLAQAALLRELFGEGTYLCVVGDDDQSIYKFRGAEVRNILEFPRMFPGAEIIRLEKNYRSCGRILKLANSVISINKGRHGKTLRAVRPEGKLPNLVFLYNGDEEARFCSDLILSSVRKGGVRYSDWAIVYRTNAQSMSFESVFVRRKIPYKVVGSLKFYEREEIKDAIALLAFMINPKDEVNFRRVINKPARGIGAQTLEKILNERWNEEDWNIGNTLKRIKGSFSAKVQAGIAVFLKAIESGRGEIGLGGSGARPVGVASGDTAAGAKILMYGEGLSACVARLVENSGIAAYHRDNDPFSADTRIANLQELVNSASIYQANPEGLQTFLERIELDRSLSADEAPLDCVTLITLHNTKGLEFRRVVMAGMEQGLFPRYDKKDEDLEEERRLFYVGCTRAMDELYFTSCSTRQIYGQYTPTEPSVFLDEADKSLLEVSGMIPAGFRYMLKETKKERRREAVIIKRKTSSDGLWRIGDAVFNDDYGYGEVTGIIEEEDEPIIKVHIVTGGDVKFLSSSQRKNWTKIKD